jgi:hypothetical protein
MADINVIINNIESKVRATVLAGLNVSLTGDITASDTVLTAFGRLQYQLDNINLSGYVPYTGATQDLNMGIWSVASTGLTLNGLTASRLVATNGSKTLESITGTGFVKVTSGVISYDTNTYLTSVGLSMPSAFTVSNSPLIANGTLAVTGAGVASQYVRGDGTLANFPTTSGGGSSVSYYFNGSVNQGTILGNVYYELNKVPIIGVGTDFTINANGYIAQFITDANDPALLEIPAGNWNFEMFFSASSGGGSPSFYVELYKYNGTAFTLIASNSATPEGITNGTAIDLYTTALAVPQTTLTLTDRLAIRVYVTHSSRTIKLHTENSHLCQVITTFSSGLTALNGLTSQVQYLAVGTTGADFNISSAIDTHTFNLPTASAINRGALSSADWSAFNGKLTNPMTTEGDIIYGGASGVATRLAKGTNTWFLRAGATIPEYFNLFGTANSWSATQTINGVEVSSSAIIQNTTTAIYRINNQTGYNRIIGGTTANADPTLTMYGSLSGAPNLITYDAQEHRIRLLNSTNLAVFTSTSATFSVPLTLSNITSGSILFADTSGLVSQNNTNFFWNNTNRTLILNAASYAGGGLAVAAGTTAGRVALLGSLEIITSGSPGSSGQGIRVVGSNRTIEFMGVGGSSINATDNQRYLFTNGNGSAITRTSGVWSEISNANSTFAPTSGTSTYTLLNLVATINQTGGANGITRGIHINPILTSASDFRAFEASRGLIVLGRETADPAIGVNGAIYYNTTTNKFRAYENGAWANLI